VGSRSDAPEKPSREINPTLRRLGMIAGAIVVIALLIWGVKYLLYARTHASTDDAKVDAMTAAVTSKITERVDRIYVDTDQRVRKGRLLIQLDDRDERSRFQQAQSAVTAQRAQAAAAQANVTLTQQTVAAQSLEGLGGITQAQSGVSNAQSGASAAQGEVDAARAEVPAAQQAFAKASADLARTQSLVATGDLPRQQIDAAKAVAASALASLSAARDKLASAQAQAAGAAAGIGGAQGGLQSAQGKYREASAPSRISASQAQASAAFANVASLQAQLQFARDQLADTRIVAPLDGSIGEKNVDVGQTVQPGTTLLTIIPSQNIYITANYKETQVGDMRAGQPVDISIDAYKGVPFHGHVIAINPASQNTYSLVPAQNASGNFIKVTQRIPVKISIDDARADMPLRPGMSVETSVRVK
jgi:membrane fusion protein (multidrug efflux system)